MSCLLSNHLTSVYQTYQIPLWPLLFKHWMEVTKLKQSTKITTTNYHYSKANFLSSTFICQTISKMLKNNHGQIEKQKSIWAVPVGGMNFSFHGCQIPFSIGNLILGGSVFLQFCICSQKSIRYFFWTINVHSSLLNWNIWFKNAFSLSQKVWK